MGEYNFQYKVLLFLVRKKIINNLKSINIINPCNHRKAIKTHFFYFHCHFQKVFFLDNCLRFIGLKPHIFD